MLPAGSTTLIATKSGYNPKLVQGVNVPSSGPVTQNIQLQPVDSTTPVSKIEFVLTWADHPDDLDSHLSGPDGQGGRFHILYNNPAPVDFADLDIDDTTAFGPERVTVRRSLSAGTLNDELGEYHYWIHNFSQSTFGPSDPNDPTTASNATVTVLVDGVQLGRYLVASATGNLDDDIWHVVNLQIDANGTAVPTVIQTLQLGDVNTTL